MPRHPMPKKNADLLKLEGTYRKDRHAARDESAMTTLLDAPPSPPASLKTDHARQAWAVAIPPLVYTHRVAPEDMPIIETAFRALDDAERYHIASLLMEPDDPRITSYGSLIKNNRQQFIDTMRKFGATSQDRLALLDVMAGVKKKASLTEQMTGGDDGDE